MLPSRILCSSFAFRALIIAALVASLFAAACGTNSTSTPPQLIVTTTSSQLPTGAVNTAYPQTTLTAANGTVPYTWSITSGSLPPGMSLSSAGVLSGMPTQGGVFNFTVTAKDAAGATAAANLTVTVNQPPAITSANNATFTVGASGTFAVMATGFPAPTFTETGVLPSGVTLSSAGVLSGTAAPGSGGTYSITITAQNGIAPNATQGFTLTVNQPPAITSAGSTTFVVGTAGTFTVKATGFPAPTFGEIGNLPSGVTLNTTTGVLSGTPASGQQGSYAITFTAHNGIGTDAMQSFTLTVGLAPAITSVNGTTFTVGTAGSFTVTATGFPAPTFGEIGSLPTGVTLNTTTGVLSGTPAAGTGKRYLITIIAQNGIGSNAMQSFALTVDEAPTITSSSSQPFAVNLLNSFTVTATGFPGPTLSESGPLPGGVGFNTGTGVLSGTPTAMGTFPITFTAHNGVGSDAVQNFTLTVVPGQAPAITSAASAAFTVSTPGTFTITTTGVPTSTVSLSGRLPSGINFSGAIKPDGTGTGILTLSGRTTTSGSFTLTVTAANGVSPSATQNFTLNIVAAPTISNFAAAANTITAGTSTMLTGFFTGGTGSIDNGVGPVMTGVAVKVSPAATTTYTLTVTNPAGTSVTKQLTVTVVPAPVITSFTASPTTILLGDSATLTPVFDGGPGITGAITNNVDSTSIAATSNVGVMVSPSATTTYTLTVTNTATMPATATATAMVTVNAAPTFTSSGSTVFFVGSNSTFLVTTTGNPKPSLSVTSGSLPSSVTFHDNGNGTASISGTPVAGDLGSHPVTITASNGIGANATQSFTLTVTAGPASISTVEPFPIFAGGPATTFNITVANDVPGDVVTAALTVDSNTTFNCTTATCGTLAPSVTFVSLGNYTVSYTPPPSTPGFVQTYPTILVTSNQSSSIPANDSFEVDPAGILVTTDDNNGLNEASSVNRSRNLVQIGSAPKTVIVKVYNDTTGAGVTFAPLTGSGYACANIGANTCGTLGAPGAPVLNGTTSTTTITYTPPPSLLPSAPYDRPRIQAVSKANPTRSGSIVFVLNSNPVTNLAFRYNTKFNSVLTGAAPTVQTMIATLVNDAGVSKSINWTLTAGSPAAPCQPTCGTLGTATVTVNGNTVRSVITYTPPSSVPTGTGQVQPTITATSADDPAQNDSFTFTITDGTCGTGQEFLLNGQYAFLVRGGAAPAGNVALIGSFNADGTGLITGGSLDINNSGFGPSLNSTILSAQTGSLPASSYSVGADDRGCLTLSDSGGGLQTFRFSLGTIVNNSATEGRIIRFDDTSWRGRAQSGVLMKQDPTSFNTGALTGSYAFGEVGVDSSGGRFAGAGVVTSNGTGAFTNIIGDFDDAGTASGPVTGGTGTYTVASNGRGTGTTALTIFGKSPTANLVLYMVSPSEALFMTTDPQSTGEPILSGEIKKQTGPFTTTTLDNKDYVFHLEGVDTANGGNTTAIGQSTFTTNGSATLTTDINDNGANQTEVSGAATFTIPSNGNGRATISGPAAPAPSPILYLIDSSSAFLVGTDGQAQFGFVEQQTSGLSTASFSGQFFFGGDAPTTAHSYDSGTVTLDGAGNVTGIGDSSGPNGLKVDVISPSTGGTYSFSATSTPAGKGAVGTNSIAYAISASKIVFMSTGTNPEVFIVQQ